MGNVFKTAAGKVVVKNDYDQPLEVSVAQETKRKQARELNKSVGVDGENIAEALSGSEDAGERALGFVKGLRGTVGGSSKCIYELDYSTFAVIGPGKFLPFNLPAGNKKEFYVTIRTIPADDDGTSASHALCNM